MGLFSNLSLLAFNRNHHFFAIVHAILLLPPLLTGKLQSRPQIAMAGLLR
jgi:hypothetical protein